jgi:WD40 repeat protein
MNIHGFAARRTGMGSGVAMVRWCAMVAAFFMLAAAARAGFEATEPAGDALHVYLGVELRGLTPEEARTLRVSVSDGTIVTKVEANSPAGSAGLRRGDILLEIDGKPVASAAQVLKIVAGRMPGASVTLRVMRRGRLRTGVVKLGVKLEEQVAAVAAPSRLEEPAEPAASEVPAPAQRRQDAPAGERANVEIVPQLGHMNQVTSVAISRDGKLAISASWDNTLKLWDLASGREIREFKDSDTVTSVAISPDGRTALSGSWRSVNLWDLATGHVIREFSVQSTAGPLSVTPDGKTALSVNGDMTLKLWDLSTGREIRRFRGHTSSISSVAISSDGKTALSGSEDANVRVWDLASGRQIHELIKGHSDTVTSVAISPDGKTALSGSADKTLKLWDLSKSLEIREFKGHTGGIISVTFSPDGKTALSGGDDKILRLWDLATGRQIREFRGHTSVVTSVAISPDGKTALSGSADKTLKLWDLSTGQQIREFGGYLSWVNSVAISPDGRTALLGSGDSTVKVWDLANGRQIHELKGHSDTVTSVAISPDGKTALSGSGDKTLKLWDLSKGLEIREFKGHTDRIGSAVFSPDGKTALSGQFYTHLKLWDLASGQQIREFEGDSAAFAPDGKTALSGSTGSMTLSLWDLATGSRIREFEKHLGSVTSVAISLDGKTALSGSVDDTLKLWDLATGSEIREFKGHTSGIKSVAISPDGKTALSGGDDKIVRLWDLATGREIREFRGHTSWVSSVAISPDGKSALSGSSDGTARLWNLQSGEELADLLSSRDGEALVITPSGFFAGSSKGADMLGLVRGFEVSTIGQVHQSLFNPDLVREALAGDPDNEVKHAAEVINLDKVVDSGPPPLVEIISHPPTSKSNADLVTLVARFKDRGKGIGRIEWRVNGITTGVTNPPAGSGPDYEVRQILALDPGDNQIEVIAYEGRNLLASLPACATIAYEGPADKVKPKLHILAIGINAYGDRGWTPPGSSETLAFPPLNLAVADAKAFGAEMQKAGAGQYSEVHVTEALDADATPVKLDALLNQMAVSISPRDTFVLYAAAHGYSLNGRYYLIPQDYEGGNNPQALASRAIGQEHLQDWIANRIKAKKAVILLDTCESGALVGGYTRSRTDAPASEAAIGRLHEATGRPVLTAAATGKPAFEGYKGHGVFTYALMEALHEGDTNNDGIIELTELVAHVEKRVPELVAELDKYGGVVKGIAVTAMRGASGDKQSAHFGSTGEDFALVARLP